MVRISLLAPGLALVLAACGARAGSAPAWPKMAEAEDDGGESLAPRRTIALSAAEKKPAKPDAEEAAKPDVAEDAPAAKAAKPDVAEPAGDTPDDLVITADEEIIDLDDLVIEIEDD